MEVVIDNVFFSVHNFHNSILFLYNVLSSREDGKRIEGVGEDVVVFALVFGLVSHENRECYIWGMFF